MDEGTVVGLILLILFVGGFACGFVASGVYEGMQRETGCKKLHILVVDDAVYKCEELK